MNHTICIAEDRPQCETALRLLLLSLKKHCPDLAVNLFYPASGSAFVKWAEQFPQLRLRTDRLRVRYGWNIKPQAMLRLLGEGFDEVTWIDSDIIVRRSLLSLFDPDDSVVLVTTEDALGDDRDDRNALRARLWGLPVGRVLPFGLNTGVLRVSKEHQRLLERWWELVQSPTYQDFQSRPWSDRPVHMLGDQDVLTALLSSKEFCDIPIRILRRGRDILQFNGIWGYTVAERATNLLRGGPAFIHAFATKPWLEASPTESSVDLKEFVKRLYGDLSPYTISALEFSHELGTDVTWMEPRYALSRVLRSLGLGCPALVGLPISAFADLSRVTKFIWRSCRSNSSLSRGSSQTGDRR